MQATWVKALYTRPRLTVANNYQYTQSRYLILNVLRMKSHCNYNSENSSESLELVFTADMQN